MGRRIKGELSIALISVSAPPGSISDLDCFLSLLVAFELSMKFGGAMHSHGSF